VNGTGDDRAEEPEDRQPDEDGYDLFDGCAHPPHASNPQIVRLESSQSNSRKAACSAWVAIGKCERRETALMRFPANFSGTRPLYCYRSGFGNAHADRPRRARPFSIMMMMPEAAEMPRREVGLRGAGREVIDFFLKLAFDDDPTLQIAHFDDQRFRGVYLLYTHTAAIDLARRLADQLVLRAVTTRVSTPKSARRTELGCRPSARPLAFAEGESGIDSAPDSCRVRPTSPLIYLRP
jgi:hypothetical protein